MIVSSFFISINGSVDNEVATEEYLLTGEQLGGIGSMESRFGPPHFLVEHFFFEFTGSPVFLMILCILSQFGRMVSVLQPIMSLRYHPCVGMKKYGTVLTGRAR